MKFRIALGCNGRVERTGFVLCNSVENTILEISDTTKKEIEALQFLTTLGLIENDIYDWNKVVHTISFLKDRFNLITPEQLVEIQMFWRTHKMCGVYLRIDLA